MRDSRNYVKRFLKFVYIYDHISMSPWQVSGSLECETQLDTYFGIPDFINFTPRETPSGISIFFGDFVGKAVFRIKN